MKKYKCTICKYEYDPAQGDPTQGIAPGTPFEQLPADWKCPRCKQGKEKFEPIEGTSSSGARREDDVCANPYAGTQTEKNLHAAFAGESEVIDNNIISAVISEKVTVSIQLETREKPFTYFIFNGQFQDSDTYVYPICK